MLLDEIDRKRKSIARLGRQYGARRLRVFGSVARREGPVDSDVDFLFGFPRRHDLFAQRLPLAEKLADLLQRPVELIPEHELNRRIRERIIQEAVDV
jgi:predicted nucleotidyltransferase